MKIITTINPNNVRDTKSSKIDVKKNTLLGFGMILITEHRVHFNNIEILTINN